MRNIESTEPETNRAKCNKTLESADYGVESLTIGNFHQSGRHTRKLYLLMSTERKLNSHSFSNKLDEKFKSSLVAKFRCSTVTKEAQVRTAESFKNQGGYRNFCC